MLRKILNRLANTASREISIEKIIKKCKIMAVILDSPSCSLTDKAALF